MVSPAEVYVVIHIFQGVIEDVVVHSNSKEATNLQKHIIGEV